MTLIMGLNLSNRIYIASDTRVTRKSIDHEGRETSVMLVDNVLKMMPVWDKNISSKEVNGDCLMLAVAGSVEVSTFLYEKVRKALMLGELSSDIRILFEQIDSFVKEMMDEWVIDMGKEYQDATLMFAGTSNNRRKKVLGQKLSELIEIFKTAKKESLKMRPLLFKELATEGSFMHMIDQKLREQAGKTVIQSLDESSIPVIPEHIQEVIEKENPEMMDFPDSLIFGVSIELGGEVSKEKAEWGEMLAYGGVRNPKEHLSKEMLAQFELGTGSEKSMPDLFEGAIMSKEIETLAVEKGIRSIGGTVILGKLMQDNFTVFGNGVRLDAQAKSVKAKIEGREIALVPFNTYFHLMKSSDGAEL